ncbi:MAG: hypothetical protein Ct9H300mP12_14300 [Acidimicrobiales bacterium]|nr:MAG: hypothetical protein Ct9H300mP12_14300 [Acidimicrobiales bacterium]
MTAPDPKLVGAVFPSMVKYRRHPPRQYQVSVSQPAGLGRMYRYSATRSTSRWQDQDERRPLQPGRRSPEFRGHSLDREQRSSVTHRRSALFAYEVSLGEALYAKGCDQVRVGARVAIVSARVSPATGPALNP